jgi:hypothetical protein
MLRLAARAALGSPKHGGESRERARARLERLGLAKFFSLQSQRDGQIVAWHEVPGTARPQKSRPVGYGLIRVRRRVL